MTALEVRWDELDTMIVPFESNSRRDYTKDPLTYCELCGTVSDSAAAVADSTGKTQLICLCLDCSKAVVLR